MRNIKLTIEYDGKEYNGWQKQPNKLNIQGEIEKAISNITGEEVELNVAAGQIIVDEIDTYKLNIEVGMGNVEIQGEVNQDIMVECGMGQVTMALKGDGKDFNYVLECGLGALNVEDIYTIAGIGDVELNNNAGKEMEISAGMGAVNVTFDE